MMGQIQMVQVQVQVQVQVGQILQFLAILSQIQLVQLSSRIAHRIQMVQSPKECEKRIIWAAGVTEAGGTEAGGNWAGGKLRQVGSWKSRSGGIRINSARFGTGRASRGEEASRTPRGSESSCRRLLAV